MPLGQIAERIQAARTDLDALRRQDALHSVPEHTEAVRDTVAFTAARTPGIRATPNSQADASACSRPERRRRTAAPGRGRR